MKRFFNVTGLFKSLSFIITPVSGPFILMISDVLSWEKRIKWTNIEYESPGAKKQFTIVEL